MKAFLTWVQDDQKQGWDILAFLRIIKCLVSREYSFTIPLILKSDWLLHLPYITFLESNVTVIRIKEMITNLKSSCLSNKFSLYHHRKCKEKSVEIRIMKLGCKRWSPSHLCSAGVPQQKTDFSIGLYLSLNFVCFGSFVFTSEAFEENKNKKNNIIYPSTSSRNVFNIGMSNRFGERIAQLWKHFIATAVRLFNSYCLEGICLPVFSAWVS